MQFTRSPSRQYTQYPQLPARTPPPTRWPIFQPWTPSPIASIRPTASWPGTLGHSIGKVPSTVAESEWHTPQASTRMRTWPSGGSITGFSVSSSLPGLTACTARYVAAPSIIQFLRPMLILLRCFRSLGIFNCRKGQSFDREGQSDVWNSRARSRDRRLPRRTGGLYPGLDRFVQHRLHDCTRSTAIRPNRASRHALEAHRCLRRESFMHLRQRTARQPTSADVNHPTHHGGPGSSYTPRRSFVGPYPPCRRHRLGFPVLGRIYPCRNGSDGRAVGCHASDVRNGAGEAFSENRRRHKSAHH